MTETKPAPKSGWRKAGEVAAEILLALVMVLLLAYVDQKFQLQLRERFQAHEANAGLIMRSLLRNPKLEIILGGAGLWWITLSVQSEKGRWSYKGDRALGIWIAVGSAGLLLLGVWRMLVR